MIGHYLLTLTPEQEDRVLTGKMARTPEYVSDGCGCLKGVVHGYSHRKAAWDMVGRWGRTMSGWDLPPDVVGARYDRLCLRFGVERTNAAIRNRILSNQARRALAEEVATVAA